VRRRLRQNYAEYVGSTMPLARWEYEIAGGLGGVFQTPHNICNGKA
jgi:hypothetical protein